MNDVDLCVSSSYLFIYFFIKSLVNLVLSEFVKKDGGKKGFVYPPLLYIILPGTNIFYWVCENLTWFFSVGSFGFDFHPGHCPWGFAIDSITCIVKWLGGPTIDCLCRAFSVRIGIV